MKYALLVVMILFICSIPALAGEYLVNNTGRTAYGLEVTFSEPVTIVDFGDALMVVHPTGMSITFTFSGAQLDAGKGQWFAWKPASATIIEYRWITTNPNEPIPATINVTHATVDGYMATILSSSQWSGGGGIAFDPSSSRLLVGRYGGIDCFDTKTWSQDGTFDSSGFYPVFLTVDPIGNKVIAGGIGERWVKIQSDYPSYWVHSAKYWNILDPNNGNQLPDVGQPISALACSITGVVACGTFDGQIWIVNGNSNTPPRFIDSRKSVVDSLAFSSDGRLLAAVFRGTRGGKNCVRVYRISDGKEIRTISPSTDVRVRDRFYSVSFSPNGAFLAIGEIRKDRGIIGVWRVDNWLLEVQSEIGFINNTVGPVTFTKNNCILAVVTSISGSRWESRLVCLDWADGSLIINAKLASSKSRARLPSMTVSPDNKYVAVRVDDQVIVLDIEQLLRTSTIDKKR